jgi:hypothetical protein
MPAILPFSDEQARLLVNLSMQYDAWIEAERAALALPYNLRWKTSNGTDYLYHVLDRVGNARSLGPRSPETEARYAEYRDTKEAVSARRRTLQARLSDSSRIYRALRLPMLPAEAAAILREADRRSLLGDALLVVGTNAMAAYAIEAGGIIADAMDETDDFDMTWCGDLADHEDMPVWSLLKAVDSTYTVNAERPFQARNAKAYEVELLAAPSKMATLGRKDRPRPVPLPEQEWLLLGRPVSHVLVARDNTPCRVVAPDPRWMALHKAWLSVQPKRHRLKQPKDARQARALLDAVWEAMPQYPLDDAFAAALPAELAPHYAAWQATRAEKATPDWR